MNHFLEHWGYTALFVLAVVEAACIPFPSEVTFGFSGSLAAQHQFGIHLVPVMIIGVVGEIIGSFGGYYIGKRGGRPLIDRYGKYVLLSHRDLDRTDKFMEKHGDVAVLFGRMLPLLRSFSALAGGIGEMPLARFGVFTAIGTAIYGVAITSLGYGLGSEWNKIVKGFTWAGIAMAAIVAIVVVVAFLHRFKEVRSGAGQRHDS